MRMALMNSTPILKLLVDILIEMFPFLTLMCACHAP